MILLQSHSSLIIEESIILNNTAVSILEYLRFSGDDVGNIDNNTPFHFIFDWGVSYWPRADDKEHNFAWRLHICQRAECLPEGFSPRANTEPEGKCVAWGRNYVLFPWEQGQYETPRSNLKWKGVLLFIVHPYHYFKTTKYFFSYRNASELYILK